MLSDALWMLASLPAMTAAITRRVDVGLDGQAFSPNQLPAEPGDLLVLYNYGRVTFTQSSFEEPCQPLDFGINSGFAASGLPFVIQINDTEPIWLYTAQGLHCSGLVVNQPAPPSPATLPAYQEAAANAINTPGSADPRGGQYYIPRGNSTTHAPWGTYTTTIGILTSTNVATLTTDIPLVETVTYVLVPVVSSLTSTATPPSATTDLVTKSDAGKLFIDAWMPVLCSVTVAWVLWQP